MHKQAHHTVLWLICLLLAGPALAQQESVKPSFDRDWKIFVVPFSHTDVGFTAPVPEVIDQHMVYLDSVVAWVDQTLTDPPESRFKWSIEITWVLEYYLERRSPEQIEALMAHVRAGRIDIGAMHFSLQTDLAGPEELVRSLYFAQELRDRYNVPIKTAVTNDTPGATWSLAQLLPKAEVPYLSLAMNSFLSDFFTTTDLPNLFYWEAQSGDRTLVWRSMHPQWAYLEGAVWGLYGSYSGVFSNITSLLYRLEREGYPYDTILINAATGDNGAPRLRIIENARTWNERHTDATMYVATFTDFFDYVSENVTEGIPVYRGDAPNWWTWSFASSATGGFFQSRATQALLPTAETAAAIAHGLRPTYPYPADSLRRAYINNLLFEDHNLGAVDLAGNAPFWERKMGWINSAYATAETVLDASLGVWSKTIETGSDVTLAVFNLLTWPRSEVITFSLNDPRVAALGLFDVVDVESGETVPYQVLSSDEVAFRAEAVPSLGFRTYHLRPRSEPLPAASPVQGLMLENDYYRLDIDPATAGMLRVFDKDLGQELARGDSRFNQYVQSSGTPSGLSIVASDSGSVLQRVTLQGGAGGAASYETTITLHADQKRIDFQNNYTKLPPSTLEAVDFVFDFDLPGAVLDYEIPFGQVRLFDDELSGFRTKHYAKHRWSRITSGSTSALIVSDGPAVHAYPGGFNGGVRLLTSWNNSGTAYRAGVGPLKAGFSLTSTTGTHEAGETTRYTYNYTSPLRTRVLPANQNGLLTDPAYSFLTVEGGTLYLSTLKRPMTREGFIVRLYNPSASSVEAMLQFGPEVRTAFETTLLETPTASRPIQDGRIPIAFGPYEVKTLWVDLAVPALTEEETTPTDHLLVAQNYPNPFSGTTTIHYTLPQAAHVRLTVHDVLGREVAVLVDGVLPAGPQQVQWQGRGGRSGTLASGVYFYTVEAVTPGGQRLREGRTMTLIR